MSFHRSTPSPRPTPSIALPRCGKPPLSTALGKRSAFPTVPCSRRRRRSPGLLGLISYRGTHSILAAAVETASVPDFSDSKQRQSSATVAAAAIRSSVAARAIPSGSFMCVVRIAASARGVKGAGLRPVAARPLTPRDEPAWERA